MTKPLAPLAGWLYRKSPSLYDLVVDSLVGTWSLQTVLSAATPL